MKGILHMSKNYETHFFLGANSPGGFRSLYDDFIDPASDHLFILKGGPGCGKSTFMKTLGRAVRGSGESVEYIHCSGDPDSLDGVYFPALRVGYVDGTAPHVIEPRLFGAAESYVDLGAFFDLAMLRERREAIETLTREYKSHYAAAFRRLTALEALTPLDPPRDTAEAALKRAGGIISREFRPMGAGPGRAARRFLSGYTWRGRMSYFESVPALADRVYVLDNETGAGYTLLASLAEAARVRGLGAILCRSPLRPEVTEHLILPELGLAFVTETRKSPYPGECYRHLRLDAARPLGYDERAEAKRMAKLREAVLEEAVSELRGAKAAHDLLEQQYIPAMDFGGVDALARQHLDTLLK